MKIYALFDTAGRVAGFWTDDLYPPNEDGGINPAIPADVVEISAEAHARLVEFPDAWRWQNGALVAYEAPPLTPEEARAAMRPSPPDSSVWGCSTPVSRHRSLQRQSAACRPALTRTRLRSNGNTRPPSIEHTR